MTLVYFFKLLELLETSPELKRTVHGIFKQCAWAAGCTAAGGVVGGPVGAFAGAVAGAYVGYARSDDYSSLIVTLKNLSDEEKYKLQRKVQDLVGSGSIEALIEYIQSEVNRGLLLGVLKEGLGT